MEDATTFTSGERINLSYDRGRKLLNLCICIPCRFLCGLNEQVKSKVLSRRAKTKLYKSGIIGAKALTMSIVDESCNLLEGSNGVRPGFARYFQHGPEPELTSKPITLKCNKEAKVL
ncbi:uncharacterized protein LOC110118982 [Ceratitis capitata]|uniref:uncharacterized protein LOC110118982 n=1 Tax=Ceratitis capitata TaxID=7213 RepID=UPI000A11596C|nr:uncharacterized protein LOC110118982 [Ceratitis capitata]